LTDYRYVQQHLRRSRWKSAMALFKLIFPK
jgi:hypothetical protein